MTDDDIELIRHDLAILSRFPNIPMPVTHAVGRLKEMVGMLLEEREAFHEQSQQGAEAEPPAPQLGGGGSVAGQGTSDPG